jgi:23S rRNA (uracil1939-C5)-methyltransferase
MPSRHRFYSFTSLSGDSFISALIIQNVKHAGDKVRPEARDYSSISNLRFDIYDFRFQKALAPAFSPFSSRKPNCYVEKVTQDLLKVGDLIEVIAERIAYGGDAVARHLGLAIFIPFAAPGERLRVRITETRKNFARAKVEQIIEASPARREPPCQYFGHCGGCQLQHIAYEAQLEAKAGFVRDALERVGRIEWPGEISVHSAKEFGYRARAQVKIARPLSGASNQSRAVGFHYATSHDVCDVESCPILVPELDRALTSLRSTINKAEPEVFNQSRPPEIEIAAGEAGVASEPPILNETPAVLEREARGARYRFDARTFFQVNALLLEQLIDEAVDDYTGRAAIDLYAGVGLFAIQLARRFDKVYGVESDRRASGFARENIRENKASNVEFFNDRAESWLEKFIARRKAQDARIDLVLLDPPRAGASRAIPLIAMLKPRRISYVSCDPATLARDLRQLIDSGYKLEAVAALDLFPQTFHIETVARLRR